MMLEENYWENERSANAAGCNMVQVLAIAPLPRSQSCHNNWTRAAAVPSGLDLAEAALKVGKIAGLGADPAPCGSSRRWSAAQTFTKRVTKSRVPRCSGTTRRSSDTVKVIRKVS